MCEQERPLIPEACRFSAYEMTQYILKAFALEDETKSRNGNTFRMYGYAGSLKDLFLLVDELATSEGKIQQVIEVPKTAWGCGWNRMSPGTDTNLNYSEIDLFMERVHYLLNQMVIGPGNARDIMADLPWIHLTEYGKTCIAERDILPYDMDGYLARVKACSNHDDWDIYYVDQVLKCFNAGVYNASAMMLGIEGEYLAERIINSYLNFLDANESLEKSKLDTALAGCGGKISQKYTKYCESLKSIRAKKDGSGNLLYPGLKNLSPRMDDSANTAFMNYLRLTRNELGHPSGVIMEPAETMLLIVSFLKYYEIQNDYLAYYATNS